MIEPLFLAWFSMLVRVADSDIRFVESFSCSVHVSAQRTYSRYRNVRTDLQSIAGDNCGVVYFT
jgi:hypothetical protein